jgi:hypothetical protein
MHERDGTVSKSSLAKTEGDLIGNLKHDAYIYIQVYKAGMKSLIQNRNS